MPKGAWFCNRCKWARRVAREAIAGTSTTAEDAITSAPCHFCHQREGAMKPDRDRALWAHVGCVWYDPDAFFADPGTMQPFAFRRAPTPERAAPGGCGLCEDKQAAGGGGGLTIQCQWLGCQERFHARCAQRMWCFRCPAFHQSKSPAHPLYKTQHTHCHTGKGGYLGMEPVFGGLLIEAYCHAHKDERLDPSVLVARAREALEEGPPPLVDALDEMEVRWLVG